MLYRLNLNEILNCSLVSRTWFNMINNCNAVWKHFCNQRNVKFHDWDYNIISEYKFNKLCINILLTFLLDNSSFTYLRKYYYSVAVQKLSFRDLLVFITKTLIIKKL